MGFYKRHLRICDNEYRNLVHFIGLDKQKKNESKVVNIFLPISVNICFVEKKKRKMGMHS